VMKRPWIALILSCLVLAVFVAPVARLQPWSIGAAHLPPEDEARRGYETLAASFPRGWMAPVIALIEAPKGKSLLDHDQIGPVIRLADSLERDPRSGTVVGLHQVLRFVGGMLPGPRRAARPWTTCVHCARDTGPSSKRRGSMFSGADSGRCSWTSITSCSAACRG